MCTGICTCLDLLSKYILLPYIIQTYFSIHPIQTLYQCTSTPQHTSINQHVCVCVCVCVYCMWKCVTKGVALSLPTVCHSSSMTSSSTLQDSWGGGVTFMDFPLLFLKVPSLVTKHLVYSFYYEFGKAGSLPWDPIYCMRYTQKCVCVCVCVSAEEGGGVLRDKVVFCFLTEMLLCYCISSGMCCFGGLPLNSQKQHYELPQERSGSP